MVLGSFAEGATIAITIKAIDEFSKEIDNVEKGITGLSKKTELMAAGVVAAGIAAVGIIGNLSVEAARAEDQMVSFNRIVGDDRIWKEMQKNVLGTVDKFTLMSAATTAVNRGIKKEFLPTIADFSQRLADADPQFRDVVGTMNSLTTAIATGRTAMLARMGIDVDAQEIIKQYGINLAKQEEATLGVAYSEDFLLERAEKLTSGLDETSKSAIIQEEIMRQLQQKLTELPQPTVDAADKMAQLNTQFKEAKIELGQELAPSFQQLLEAIVPVIPTVAEFVKQLTPLLGLLVDIGKWIIYFAEAGLEAINFAFKGWLLLINDVINGLKALWDFIKKIVDFFDKGFDKINSFLGSSKGAMGQFQTNTKKVKDAIITPTGQVIETDPMDYLIATKNPGGMGGITVYIDSIYGMNPEQVSRALKRELSMKVNI